LLPTAEEADELGIAAGRRIFRYDTFGDQQLWTDVLRMHEVVATAWRRIPARPGPGR
jgi:hypothetical protein